MGARPHRDDCGDHTGLEWESSVNREDHHWHGALTRLMTQLSIVELDETGNSHKGLARHRRGVRTGTVRRGDLAIDGAPPDAGGVISRSNGRDAGFGRQWRIKPASVMSS